MTKSFSAAALPPSLDRDVLRALAWRRELAQARRLVAAGWDERAALAHAMGAGDEHALARIAAQRRAARAAQDDARAARAALRAQAAAGRRAPPAGVGWRGWFDGCAHPNPGRIGLGALLEAPGGARQRLSRPGGHGDSSAAEYLALIALLELALAAGAAAPALHGDSKVVIDDVNQARAGRPDRCAARLAPWRARALALLARLDGATLRWIPRARNADADALSQQAIGYHEDLQPMENDDARRAIF